jgi:hypothetical protein
MPQAGSIRSDYTGFMLNRTALAALLLALAAPSWANTAALQEARTLNNGGAAAYDGGCTGGSCGAEESAIDGASRGALQTGGLTVVKGREPRPAMIAEVPNPDFVKDEKDAKDKPGFFKRLFSGKGLMYTLGGAAAGGGLGWLAGAAIGSVGGPIGAVVGALVGGLLGFFLAKMMAK